MDESIVQIACPQKLAQFIAELVRQGVTWKCDEAVLAGFVQGWEVTLTGGY